MSSSLSVSKSLGGYSYEYYDDLVAIIGETLAFGVGNVEYMHLVRLRA